jgi:HEAT repeat protein
LAILEFFPNLVTQDIIFIWLVPLLLMGGMLFWEAKILKKVPHIFQRKDLYEQCGSSFVKIFADIRQAKFLKYLLIVVLLQSVLYTVTEFEFIRTLDSNFEQDSAKISLNSDLLQTNIFSDIEQGATEIVHLAEQEIEKTSSKLFAHETLLHDLTGLSLIFGVLALLVQFLLTPWVLSKFGIVRAINLYFAGFLAMSFSFIFGGHLPINFVRGFEHSFHSLFMSGYHLSFYSVVEKSREFLRHIVEGMITPLGIILAVLIVAGLKQFSALIFLPLIIALLAAGIFGVSVFLHKSRTVLAKKNLENAENISQKIRAIEVLGQSGQYKAHHLLANELKNQNNHQVLREKITETLVQIKNLETIHAYIHILEKKEESLEIKMRVLEAMLEIENLREYSQNRHFMRFKIINILQSLFNSAKSSYLKKLVVMNIFQHLPAEEIVPFFHKIMQSNDEKLQAVCLRSCAMFNDPDIVTFVEPYLNHSSPRVRSHAVIALWKFSDQEKLRGILDDFLSADHQEANVAGIYVIGEVEDKQSLKKLYQFSREDNLEVRLHSLIARAKLGDERSISGILELLFSAKEEIAHKVFNMLKRGVPTKLREKIKEAIHREVASRVMNILTESEGEIIEKQLSKSVLEYLKRLYHFAGNHDDLLILEQRYS